MLRRLTLKRVERKWLARGELRDERAGGGYVGWRAQLGTRGSGSDTACAISLAAIGRATLVGGT